MSSVDSLHRKDRIAIACRFYGLYTIGFASTEREKVDEDCCMDNMRVPYRTDQLTEDMQQYLSDLNVRRKK